MDINFLRPKVSSDQLLSQQPKPQVTSFFKRVSEFFGATEDPAKKIARLLDKAIVVVSKKGVESSPEFNRFYDSVKVSAQQINPSVTDKDVAKLTKQLIAQKAAKPLSQERQVVVFKEIDKMYKLGFIPEHAKQLKIAVLVAGVGLALSTAYALTAGSITPSEFDPDTQCAIPSKFESIFNPTTLRGFNSGTQCHPDSNEFDPGIQSNLDSETFPAVIDFINRTPASSGGSENSGLQVPQDLLSRIASTVYNAAVSPNGQLGVAMVGLVAFTGVMSKRV